MEDIFVDISEWNNIFSNIHIVLILVFPLNYCTATQELLSQLDLIEEYITAIEQCVQHQKIIADDVLNLSKLEANKVELDVSPVRPKELIISSVSMLKAQINQK